MRALTARKARARRATRAMARLRTKTGKMREASRSRTRSKRRGTGSRLTKLRVKKMDRKLWMKRTAFRTRMVGHFLQSLI